MAKKAGFLKKMLSYITYKDKKQVKEFYVPTVDELKDEKVNNEGTNYNEKNNDYDKKSTGVVSGVNSKDKTQEDINETITTSIEDNIKLINSKFNAPTNKDIIIRRFLIADKYMAFIAYLDGMVNEQIINDFILRPLLNIKGFQQKEQQCQLDYILESILETNKAQKLKKPKGVINEILLGNTVLYINECNFYVTNETKGFPARGVEKPAIEGTVTGAQEAFNESLRVNISLVRKIIKNENLTTEFLSMGERNKNQCAIMYLNGLVNPAIVDEVKRRISSIETDYNAGDGMIEQFIEDSTFSIIPTMLTTERPDRTASHIAEGRVAIICEGTPFAKVVPINFVSLLHSPEDAFMRFPYGTILRLVRLIGMFIATLLPSIYVAMTNFHQEMIPTDLLIAIVKAKENVPFPTIVEVVLMEFSFELIREAGIRIPGIIGNTLGIIGALILGQAAVQANIVSPVLIIIVAITGLGNFAIPSFSLGLAIRLIRFGFIASGALLGFYGITCFMMLLGIYLVNIKSFGIPIFAPVLPRTSKSNDYIVRYPVWKQDKRIDSINPLDTTRQPKISRKWTVEDADYNNDGRENDDKGR
ncbi:spore germination protein [Clostridium folliculivorans]|uniref:Spore germination protein KA n=1 Tax=Clostridium folliculivorans TaxID=2886038 RepID=A0A9W5XYX0_9CLOT|nr:spore germination protein [Clostridium folliculivorans]GKU23470.1 spore germination protein KA [Clostridium folliculivorans]GKU29586.1 spore germination protein KA [Clostridium folliculivorans]